jgi:hypothetical protein
MLSRLCLHEKKQGGEKETRHGDEIDDTHAYTILLPFRIDFIVMYVVYRDLVQLPEIGRFHTAYLYLYTRRSLL